MSKNTQTLIKISDVPKTLAHLMEQYRNLHRRNVPDVKEFWDADWGLCQVLLYFQANYKRLKIPSKKRTQIGSFLSRISPMVGNWETSQPNPDPKLEGDIRELYRVAMETLIEIAEKQPSGARAGQEPSPKFRDPIFHNWKIYLIDETLKVMDAIWVINSTIIRCDEYLRYKKDLEVALVVGQAKAQCNTLDSSCADLSGKLGASLPQIRSKAEWVKLQSGVRELKTCFDKISIETLPIENIVKILSSLKGSYRQLLHATIVELLT